MITEYPNYADAFGISVEIIHRQDAPIALDIEYVNPTQEIVNLIKRQKVRTLP